MRIRVSIYSSISPFPKYSLLSYIDSLLDKFFNQTLCELEGLVGPGVCMLCDREIAKSVKIHCMECPTPTIFCLDCLRHGRTKADSTHLPGHSYYVYDNLDFPLLMKDWSAKDELQLI